SVERNLKRYCFKKWITSEVLPSIRKHGVYATPAAALQIIRNPTGETKLHYKVKKKNIETTYPYVIISAGKARTRLPTSSVGATRFGAEVQAGQRLHRRSGDRAQEPRRPQQDEPRARRLPRVSEGCNVATLVSNSYEEVIIFLHEHYKDVKETHNMLLAKEDQQQAAHRFIAQREPCLLVQ
ncbi:MAG: hypothetical protein ACKPKO_21490, partial [Candidatus Fonsibacter sp.]